MQRYNLDLCLNLVDENQRLTDKSKQKRQVRERGNSEGLLEINITKKKTLFVEKRADNFKL